jgi:hypothetical protein
VASRIPPILLGAGAATAVANELAGWFKLGRLAWAFIALAGLVLALISLRMILQRHGQEPQDAAPPKTNRILGPRSAFAAGFFLNIVYLPNWVFTSAAVTSVAALRVGWGESFGLLMIYIATASFIGIWLSALRSFSHGRAMRVIDMVGDWTDLHAPMILLWLGFALGVGMLLYGGWQALLPPWK